MRSRGCSGLTYTLEYADEKGKFDEIVEDKGVTVLIDPKAVMFILGTEMDYVEDKLQSGFTFRNPERKGSLRLRRVVPRLSWIYSGIKARNEAHNHRILSETGRMKLFQIEEPEGGPTDPNDAGRGGRHRRQRALGRRRIVGRRQCRDPRLIAEGFEQRCSRTRRCEPRLPQWQELFEAARLRAERALARPVTHAVVARAPRTMRQPPRRQ